jgi:hypothetical protein
MLFGDALTNLMMSFPIEVCRVFLDPPFQVPAFIDQNVIQTLPTQAPHEPFANPFARGARRGVLNSLMPVPADNEEKSAAYLQSRSLAVFLA